METASRQAAGNREIEYRLLDPLHPDEAHFTFEGPFEGRQVRWDARLLTLARASRMEAATPGRFIEIGEETPDGIALKVVLNIPHIDVPAILRTIIMIRQYKRLRRGRHVFGDQDLPDGTN